jgi:uncharacterized protein YggE
MKKSENHYIEVMGEGSYTEEVSEYIADIILEVRAAKDQTALTEISDLKDHCVKQLVASGIRNDEIIDSGREVWRPWFRRKKVGKEARHKLTLRTSDIERLSKALSEIEPLFSGQRHHFTIEMRQPVFSDNLSAVIEAQKQALEEARTKAKALAREAQLQLGGIIRIEELAKTKRSSGAYGDYDWEGDSDRFAAAAAPAIMLGDLAEESEPAALESPARTIWVKYRVRFAIVATELIGNS